MGTSVSDDGGRSWHRLPQLRPSADPEFGRLLGDPWLAAAVTNVFYVSLAAIRDGIIDDPLDFNGVTLSVSHDGGLSFGEATPVIRTAADGSKIAVAPDLQTALVTATHLQGAGLPRDVVEHVVLTDLVGPFDPTIGSQEMFAIGPPPGGCGALSVISGHAVPAIGPSGTEYVAVFAQYFGSDPVCPGGSQAFNEVYRRARGASVWERIVFMLATPNTPQMEGRSTFPIRGFPNGSLAVSSDDSGDVVLFVTLREAMVAGTVEQKAILYRLEAADTCAVATFAGCDATLEDRPVELDQSARVTIRGADAGPLLAARRGVKQYQPVVFAGAGPSLSFSDPRVGVYWYAQPFRDRPNVTTVEGVVSPDAGSSFRVLNNISIPLPGIPSELPREVGHGQVFIPCEVLPRASAFSYFGDYNHASFTSSDPENVEVSSGWADSRESCVRQGTGTFAPTSHHHVFAGLWGRPRVF